MVEKSHDECVDAQSTQGGWAFPNDQYAALEEVRKIILLSHEELNTVLAVLAKSDSSFIEFEVGNIHIAFMKNTVYSELDNGGDCLELKVEIKEENVTHSIGYALTDFAKKKLATVDDE